MASQKLFGFTLHRHVHRHLKDHFIPHAGNGYLPHVLHHRALRLYSALLLLMKLVALGSPLLLPYSITQALALTPDNVIELTNQSRRDYHLAELLPSAKLAVAAANKARDIMDKSYFAHFSPGGVSPWYWITQAGYTYTHAGENLAIRFTSAEGVNEAWLNSPTHRANILSEDFKEIGVAVLTDNFGQEGSATIVVQMFGSQDQPAKQPIAASVSPPIPAPQRPVAKSSSILPAVAATKVSIDYPLMNSYVKTGSFDILGTAAKLAKVRVYVDSSPPQTVLADFNGKFSLRLASEYTLAEGSHLLRAVAESSGGSVESPAVRFRVDFAPPSIDRDSFSILPAMVPGKYNVRAQVAEDSVRTIVTVGRDSVALTKQDGNSWTGTLQVLQSLSVERLPIEVYAQDMAGNEARVRVGELVLGQVKGLYSFVSGDASAANPSFSFLGGLVKVGDLDFALKNFYLLFAAGLGFALILKIAIARHVQHVRAIAGGAGVMMLAMILFVL